jgi:hypothetical protein
MTLAPEQKAAVATWLAAGDNLSQVQKKLREQFSLSLTYMDVRFLVDDLNLQIKDPPPKAAPAAEANKAAAPEKPAEKKGLLEKAKEKLGLGRDETTASPTEEDDIDEAAFADELPAAGAGNVKVTVDGVTLIPGAIASGSVTFPDGVTGKWIVDQQGRPGFTEVSQPGYRPSPADGQAFIQQLSVELQKKGF